MIQLPPPNSQNFNTELVRVLTEILNQQQREIQALREQVAALRLPRENP